MTEFWRSEELPYLESRRSSHAISCYRPHTHDTFSIGLIDEGSSLLTGASEDAVELLAGDVILIPAGHVHACNPDRGRWRYQMIHVDQSWVAAIANDEGAHLLGEIHTFRDEFLYRLFDEANASLFRDDSGNADADALRSDLAAALLHSARGVPRRKLRPTTDSVLAARLAPMLELLDRDDPGPVLDELAAMVGMSKFQLIRATRRATGLTPSAWRQNRRVTRARKMLGEGRSLADTAAELGFADQSHFHRVFRAHVAATPGAYRG